MRFVLCFLCVVSGCSKLPQEQEATVEISSEADVLIRKEAKEAAENSSPVPSDSLSKTVAELGASLRKLNRDEINRRSGCEGAVKEAIAVIDQYIERDPAAKQIVLDNADWYERYRNCESLCMIKTGKQRFSDFARDQFREKTVDEETAILHAFLDFTEQYRKTDVDYESSIKERSTTNQPGATEVYKETYLKASEFIFRLATNPETDQLAAIGIEGENVEMVVKRRPLFPSGSRFTNSKAENKRLFGE